MTNGIIDSGQEIVTNGLVLHLDAAQRRSYSGTGTTWTDLSGNGNNGTLTNGPTFNPANGGSIQFDGTNDNITIAHSSSINLTSTLTLEAWIYPLSLGSSWKAIVYKSNTSNSGGYHMGINPSRFLAGGVKNPSWNTSVSSTNAININEWCCVTMTLDIPNSTLKLYKNGTLIHNNTSFSGIISGNTDPLMVAQNTGASENLNGIINNVKVYNRALSDAEVLQNYNATKARFEVPALLDLYPNAAAAYSLRKLRSGYTGSAIRVRRSSDNTEQNIGFTSTGDLDTTALTTFVGANNGFVTTWYDQSGNNRNATQTGTTNQPVIVSGGTLITTNSKPSLNFDGAGDTFTATITPLFSYTNMTTFIINNPAAAAAPDATTSVLFGVDQGGANNPQFGLSFGGATGLLTGEKFGMYFTSGTVNTGRLGSSTYNHNANEQTLFSIFNLSSGVAAYKNNSFITFDLAAGMTTSTPCAPANTNATNPLFHIGTINGASNGALQKFQEVIVYPSNQSPNRIGIEANINSYYGIYNSNIDSDAQSFITAAAITDSTQQGAVDALVKDLKNYGLWTKMKAIYPFVGGTAASHKFNLKDPRDVDGAFRLVFSGGWTHSATGALPDGSTGYANTFLTPSNTLDLNSTHLSYYSKTNNTEQRYQIGVVMPTTWLGISIKYSGNTYSAVNSLAENLFADSSSLGYYLASRINTNSQKIWKNGVVRVTGNVNSTSLATIPIFIGGVNNPNSNYQLSAKECAFATIGDGLTDTEAANLYTAVQKYQTTLGRQV